ncbi:MAG TPA: alpha/beta hydrolase [Blastocatellia bacterium]|nr:alpha/beta hydrolase [Blastocatellia bacterium]
MKNRIKRIAAPLALASVMIGLAACLTLLDLRAWPSTAAQSANIKWFSSPALQGDSAIRRLKREGLYVSSQKGAETRRRPAPGTIFLYPERIRLKGGGLAEAERGMIFVPLNRSDTKGPVIGVEFYRFRARAGASANAAPIFRLHGGPGFRGLADRFAEPGYYEDNIWPAARTATGSFIEIGDLVVVGQRGIGTSKPDTLFDRAAAEAKEAAFLRGEIGEQEAVTAMQDTWAQAELFWKGNGYDLRGFNVVEAAADVNDLRKALGYEKISLLGGSFGSHWAMTVMRYYPQSITRAVLSGIEGPDHTYDMPGHVLNALQRIAAEAETSPELRDLIPRGGLIEAFKTTLARVEKEPVEILLAAPEAGKRRVRLGASAVRRLSLGYSGRAARRSEIRTWPADILTLYKGDFQKAAEWAAQGGGSPYREASVFTLDCSSGISPERRARLKADPAGAIVGPLNWDLEVIAQIWKGDLGDEFRKNFHTDIPTLMVQGNWDVATPLENAQELIPYFKNGKLVVVKGGSHAALVESLVVSESFRKAFRKFLADGDLSDIPNEIHLPPVQWAVPNSAKP